jgi:rhodanese-related sulfurtransferase
MKHILLALLITISSAIADVKNEYISQELINSHVKIIDIRTPAEWRETGILKGSIPITFFNEQGSYNIDEFLKELNKNVKQNEEFALICRSGSRTKFVSNFLSEKFGYKIINLQGGILYALGKRLPTTEYKNK